LEQERKAHHETLVKLEEKEEILSKFEKENDSLVNHVNRKHNDPSLFLDYLLLF
jgi:hypothetical protein